MPTGYTAAVVDGKLSDFPTFAMECARAFGALVMLRDEPAGAPIPERFEPSDFYAKRLDQLREELRILRLGDCEEVRARYESAMRERANSAKDSRQRAEIAKSRCLAMLEHVKVWTPPTPDHAGLKTFMVQQLEETIRFDGDTDAQWFAFDQPEFAPWREKRIAELQRDIERSREEYLKECERAEQRTKWVKALRESLGAWKR